MSLLREVLVGSDHCQSMRPKGAHEKYVLLVGLGDICPQLFEASRSIPHQSQGNAMCVFLGHPIAAIWYDLFCLSRTVPSPAAVSHCGDLPVWLTHFASSPPCCALCGCVYFRLG